MSCSTEISICLISLFTFTIFLQTPFVVVTADPLSYSCTNPQNFTAGTPYELNLNKLTGLVDYLTQPLWLCSSFHWPGIWAWSLSGDVSSFDCLTCISGAGIEARKLCPGNKGALIWYDYCMFKYLDQNFFGQIDTSVVVSLLNVNNITNNQNLFKQRNSELLGKLSQEASISTKRYASGEMVVDENTTIYGLAQCTWDISSYDCKKCLDHQIYTYLPQEKIGGRALGGSCNVRFEVYPFVKL